MTKHLLAQFCDISGQRVNKGKSRIWFSPNTPIYFHISICLEFQVLPTSNLGTYLGIPICHGQGSRRFTYLVDRVQRKLAGWKARALSHAARTILIQTTLSAVPIYTMQVNMIHASILNRLNKVCRDFFWGTSNGRGVMHTITWGRICQPKVVGGLGIPVLRCRNLALLAKLGWNMIQNPTNICNQLLQAKYGGWSSIIRDRPTCQCSLVWLGLWKTATTVRRSVAGGWPM